MKIRKLLAFVVAALALPALALASTQATSPVVSSKLKGSNEVPAKGDPDGTGFVVVTFKAAKGQACWQFKGISKIGAPNVAHIHKGRSGVAGPVVIPFCSNYKAKGCQSASKSTIEAIETNPNRYCVNLHNAKYPGGRSAANSLPGWRANSVGEMFPPRRYPNVNA